MPRKSFEPPTPAGKLTREQTQAFYERHLLAKGNHAGGDWDRLGELFAENADYHDVFYGWIHGRKAITQWLHDSMVGLEEWSFPVQWVIVGEGRVVAHWLNRLPGKRPDGSYYEFPGVSMITFNDEGLIARQVDMYDGLETLETVFEAKFGVFGRVIRRFIDWAGPAGREFTRAVYRVFERKKAGGTAPSVDNAASKDRAA